MKTTNTMEKLESTYFSKLDLKAKERYKEKIKLIENVDPCTLQKEAFTENIDCFPKVTYPDIVTYPRFNDGIQSGSFGVKSGDGEPSKSKGIDQKNT